jgi:hypothetical protein
MAWQERLATRHIREQDHIEMVQIRTGLRMQEPPQSPTIQLQLQRAFLLDVQCILEEYVNTLHRDLPHLEQQNVYARMISVFTPGPFLPPSLLQDIASLSLHHSEQLDRAEDLWARIMAQIRFYHERTRTFPQPIG